MLALGAAANSEEASLLTRLLTLLLCGPVPDRPVPVPSAAWGPGTLC